MTIHIRTKRPFTVPPNENYRYTFPLDGPSCRHVEGGVIGNPPHEKFFMVNKNNIWPKGIYYPDYAWERVG